MLINEIDHDILFWNKIAYKLCAQIKNILFIKYYNYNKYKSLNIWFFLIYMSWVKYLVDNTIETSSARF